MNQPGRRDDNPSGGAQTLKAVVVIAAVVLIGVLVLHHNPKASTATTATTKAHSSHGSTTTIHAPVSTTTVAQIPPASIKVQVLNGVGTGNLATQWSTKLRTTFGYNTLAPDNATAKVTTSAIYVMTAGYLPEAEVLAAHVGLPITAINTTIPAPATVPIKPAERAAANLVLVIGPNLAGTA